MNSPHQPDEPNQWAAPGWSAQEGPGQHGSDQPDPERHDDGQWGGQGGQRPKLSKESQLDPNDPYRYGRPDPDPSDPSRWAAPPGAHPGSHGATQYGQSPYGQPPYGQPPYGQPPYGQPGGSSYPGADPNDPYRFGPPQYGPPYGNSHGGQQPYPSPPPYSAYPQPPGRNGLALTGLILGVVALVLAWVPVIGIILGILGVVFAGVGLRQTSRQVGGGRRLAVGGLVCAVFAVIACTIWTVYLFSRVADCVQYQVNSPSYTLCINNG